MEDYIFERWKPIEGYEGLYEVSDWGRVRSVERIDCRGQRRKPKIRKTFKDKWGYMQVLLSKDGVKEHKKIHRLVVEAFIENPNNYPCVNHKTECKCFNHISSLEWCDGYYNHNYGTIGSRISDSQKNRRDCSKPVIQLDMDGNVIQWFPSAKEAERQTCVNSGGIIQVCKGRYRQLNGFRWMYAK